MAASAKVKMVFSSGFRFVKGGRVTAILDPDGKVTLKDDGGNLEMFHTWREYVTSQKDVPININDEDLILAQLSTTLGEVEVITVNAGTVVEKTREQKVRPIKSGKQPTEAAAPAEGTGDTKETEDMAASAAVAKPKKQAAKKTAPAKKTTTPKKKDPKSAENECACGCGDMVPRTFAQGHDARLKGWCLQISRGQKKLNELQPIAQKWFRDNGYKVGKG